MGSWREDYLQTLKMGEKQDDEETQGLEGGYSSDRGLSRHNLDFYSGKLGENLSDESEGEQEKEGEDSDGGNERSPPLFVGENVGMRKTNSDDVLASPTKNTRKRKSTIPAVDGPAMATRGKRGNKQALACWFQWIHWILVLCNQQKYIVSDEIITISFDTDSV